MTPEAKAGQLTKKVLKSISHHLSGRLDCKDIEYSVHIYLDSKTGDDVVEVSPYISVFPSTFHRKETDRRGIAYHVIRIHFPEIYAQSSTSVVQVKSNSLVRGSYVYKRYKLTRKRKWVRTSRSLEDMK